MPALISLRNVSKTFFNDGFSVEVLRDISLDIAAGEFVAIVGQSGSGKSTLMQIIGCLDRPTDGTYRVAGRDVGRLDKDALAALRREMFGFVFQRYNLLATATAAENVEIPAIYAGSGRGERMARAQRLLARLGVGERSGHRPGELSGGQQQRVALARALVLEPRVLLFDEPLSNLDARLRRSMRDEIRALQQRLRLTVAYVTHDQSEALAVSDRIIVMDAGRIAQHDTPQSLYEQPASEFVARFMGEAALFDGEALVDGRVRLGPLHWRPRRALPPGAVRVAVRPEAWSVAARDDGGLPGTVQKCAYLGGTQELTIATALGEVFVAWPQPEPPWTPGQAVWLHLSDHGVSVLPQVPPVACGRGR